MYLGFTTGNILQKFTKEPYNILYAPQNNCFDHTLVSIDNHKYFNIINAGTKPSISIPNLINLEPKDLTLYNYNLTINNNIIGYSQNNTFKNFHLNGILCTHSIRPPYIKKEDLALINQRLKRDAKIFFTSAAQESWKLDNSYLINYGIPTDFKSIIPFNDRTKDILVMNTEGLPYAQQIAAVAKNAGLSGDIITNLSMSVGSLNDIFNHYKVVIDLAEHNVINLLCSVAAGCVGVTMSHPAVNREYGDIDNLVFVNEPNELMNIVTNNLDSKNTEDSSLSIKNKFNFDSFAKVFNSVMVQTNNKAFIL